MRGGEAITIGRDRQPIQEDPQWHVYSACMRRLQRGNASACSEDFAYNVLHSVDKATSAVAKPADVDADGPSTAVILEVFEP